MVYLVDFVCPDNLPCMLVFLFRVCPGQHLANRSLNINLALLLWSFRISQRPDTRIDTNAYTDSVIAHAAPFEVVFTPRIEENCLRAMMAEETV